MKMDHHGKQGGADASAHVIGLDDDGWVIHDYLAMECAALAAHEAQRLCEAED